MKDRISIENIDLAKSRSKGYIWLIIAALFMTGCSDLTDNTNSAADGRWYTQAQAAHGKELFQKFCASCHGTNAEGTTEWRKSLPDGSYPPPPLNGSAHAWHHPLSVLRRTIINGGIPLGGKMPPFGKSVNSSEIDALIAYFQGKWSDEVYQAWLNRGGLR